MNWSRAQTVLIVIFLLLNTVLGYFNFMRPLHIIEASVGGDEAIAAVRDRLLQEKITLLQSIPRKIPKVTSLQLKADMQMPEYVNRLFSKQTPEVIEQIDTYGNLFYIVRGETEEVVLSTAGLLTYNNREVKLTEGSPLISYEFARSAAEQFLSERLEISTFGYQLQSQWNQGVLSPSQTVIWCRSFENSAVFDLTIEVTVLGDLVQQCTINPLRIVGEVGIEEWSTPASNILLRLVEDDYILSLRDRKLAQGENWLVIKEIQFGYFSFFDADQTAEAMPVWRVLFQDNHSVYYDALTAKRIFHG
jgi:hypothetical protein